MARVTTDVLDIAGKRAILAMSGDYLRHPRPGDVIRNGETVPGCCCLTMSGGSITTQYGDNEAAAFDRIDLTRGPASLVVRPDAARSRAADEHFQQPRSSGQPPQRDRVLQPGHFASCLSTDGSKSTPMA